MDNEFIVTRMQGYTCRATQELSAWLSDILPQFSDDWWNECVLDKLSYAQRETAKKQWDIQPERIRSCCITPNCW